METITTKTWGDVHPLISWRSVIAGLFVALFAYLMMTALGIAIGGSSLIDGLESSARSAVAAGIWVIATAAISLFLGAYFAARISRFPARLVGSSQGIVITAIFFAVLVLQMAATLGAAGSAFSSMVGTAGSGVSSVVGSPQVQDVIEKSLQGLKLKADPKQVIEGVAVRLLRGDFDGARDYLALQSGLQPAEAQARIDEVKADIQTALIEVRETTARTLSAAGWTLFALMGFGLLAAIGGGMLGSHTNFRRPLPDEELTTTYHATTPAA